MYLNKFSTQLFIQFFFIILQFSLYICCYYYYFNNILCFFASFLPVNFIKNFIFTNVFDFIYLKTIVIVSCAVISSIPTLLIASYIYFLPSLYNFERHKSFFYIKIYVLYNICCLWIFLTIIIKSMLVLLLTTNTLTHLYNISFEPRIDLYIYTILKILYIYIILIHYFFIFGCLIHCKIIKISTLLNFRKVIIILLGLLSILITPPDFFTFLYVYTPLFIIFENIILINIVYKFLYSF